MNWIMLISLIALIGLAVANLFYELRIWRTAREIERLEAEIRKIHERKEHLKAREKFIREMKEMDR